MTAVFVVFCEDSHEGGMAPVNPPALVQQIKEVPCLVVVLFWFLLLMGLRKLK